MADEDRPVRVDDPDMERAKAWWKEHGRSIVGGVVIGLSAVLGFNYWQYHQQSQAETASNLYEQLQDLVRSKAEAELIAEAEVEGDADAETETEATDTHAETETAITATADQLMSGHPASPYATHAALALAKLSVDGGDLNAAAQALEWILDNSEESGLLHVARLRLAAVLLGQDKADAAISLLQLQVNDTAGFTARYNELVGDAYLQKGDMGSARGAYQSGLEALTPDSPERALLQLKLDGLGAAN